LHGNAVAADSFRSASGQTQKSADRARLCRRKLGQTTGWRPGRAQCLASRRGRRACRSCHPQLVRHVSALLGQPTALHWRQRVYVLVRQGCDWGDDLCPLGWHDLRPGVVERLIDDVQFVNHERGPASSPLPAIPQGTRAETGTPAGNWDARLLVPDVVPLGGWLPPPPRSWPDLGCRPVRPAHAVQVGEAVAHAGLLSLDIEASGAQPPPAVQDDSLPCALGLDPEPTGLAFLHLSHVSARNVTMASIVARRGIAAVLCTVVLGTAALAARSRFRPRKGRAVGRSAKWIPAIARRERGTRALFALIEALQDRAW